jgi:hypothetical protein
MDTRLFNMQYVYYGLNYRPDVRIIHTSKLLIPTFLSQFKYEYNNLWYPQAGIKEDEILKSFIVENSKQSIVFSESPYEIGEGSWIPWGLLYRFYEDRDVPKNEIIYQENTRLWNTYHDPRNGSLSVYQNLLLSNVLKVYAQSHTEFGYWCAKRNFLDTAQKHLETARILDPSDTDIDTYLIQVYFTQKKCKDAEKILDHLSSNDLFDKSTYFYLASLDASICLRDTQKASDYEQKYLDLSRGTKVPLKKL